MLNEFKGKLRHEEEIGLKNLAEKGHDFHQIIEQEKKELKILENMPSTDEEHTMIIKKKVEIKQIECKNWEVTYKTVIRGELKENNDGLNLIKGNLPINYDYDPNETPTNFFVHYLDKNKPTITLNSKEEVEAPSRPIPEENDKEETTSVTSEERDEEVTRREEGPKTLKSKLIFTGLSVLIVCVLFCLR
jgi:hypothetical protein